MTRQYTGGRACRPVRLLHGILLVRTTSTPYTANQDVSRTGAAGGAGLTALHIDRATGTRWRTRRLVLLRFRMRRSHAWQQGRIAGPNNVRCVGRNDLQSALKTAVCPFAAGGGDCRIPSWRPQLAITELPLHQALCTSLSAFARSKMAALCEAPHVASPFKEVGSPHAAPSPSRRGVTKDRADAGNRDDGMRGRTKHWLPVPSP